MVNNCFAIHVQTVTEPAGVDITSTCDWKGRIRCHVMFDCSWFGYSAAFIIPAATLHYGPNHSVDRWGWYSIWQVPAALLFLAVASLVHKPAGKFELTQALVPPVSCNKYLGRFASLPNWFILPPQTSKRV